MEQYKCKTNTYNNYTIFSINQSIQYHAQPRINREDCTNNNKTLPYYSKNMATPNGGVNGANGKEKC